MRIAWTLCLGAIIGLAVHAQDGRGPGRGRFGGPSVGFTTLDLDSDGVLDASEIQAAPQSLGKLDPNSDGQITSDEVRISMPQGRGRGRGGRGEEPEGVSQTAMVEEMVKTLMAFDANGDSKLSREEMPERFQGIFARADENKDGFLTPDEIRKFALAQAAPPETAGRGGRGGPDGRGGDGRRGEMNLIQMDAVLAAIDTNGDGVISAEEIRNAAAAIRKLDKDGDGKVTRAEATPVGRSGGPF